MESGLESRLRIARLLVTIAALFVAIVPPLADLNETHVFNPLWIGHARLHTVWLLSTNSLIATLALVVLWRKSERSRRDSILLAGALLGAILVGFFVAGATQSVYGGTFTDPNGIAMTAGPIDANAAAFSVMLVFVVTGVLLTRKPSR